METKDLKAGLRTFKPNSLDEVRADAKYNYLKRLKEQQEKARFEEAKHEGNFDKYIEESMAEVKGEVPAKKGK